MEEDLISTKEATSFISDHHSSPVELTEIEGGKHSMAFSYSLAGKDYILRFNDTDFGFKKDRYAYENYSKYVPIPEIVAIGEYKDSFFSLSEKAKGHSIRDEYNQGKFTSLETQFDDIEKIAKIPIPTNAKGFGEWDPDTLNAPYESLSNLITGYFEPNIEFNWNVLKEREGFEVLFFEELKEKINKLLLYSEGIRELRHGDFGTSNVFIEENKTQGIIDWHKASYDDHLFDVSRVVLYCPNRDVTSKAALDYYGEGFYKNYKERILLGLYYTMLINYGAAANANMADSLKSYPTKIMEIEKYFLNKNESR